jgi:hypothetical protein
LHVPVAIGLLLGGVIVGPYVLGIFATDRPIADFMADPASYIRDEQLTVWSLTLA